RRVPLIARHGDQIIPSFALEMLRVAQGARTHVVRLAGDTGQATSQIKTGNVIVTGDDSGQITLHHGYSDRFKRVSAATIMTNDDGEGWAMPINNSFVIIGSSAMGLKDIHATALETALPGPLIHLQILHQILSERVINAGEIIAIGEIAGAVIVAIVLTLLMIRLPLVFAILLLGGVTGLAVWGYLKAFLENGFLGNVFFSVGLAIGVAVLTLTLRAAWEETRRRQLRSAFNQYLSPEMVRRIDTATSGPTLGGQTIPVSVLFMDIRGFTTLTEAMADNPQQLTTIINTIMERATAIVLDHGGTLDKYIGDALMAFWNAPMSQDDHARRAVDAAMALEAALPEINNEVRELMGDRWQGEEIRIGVGIATGDAVVGNLGSRFRFSYSCIGDTVNLAARLEPFGKNTGLSITLADTTADEANTARLVPIDNITVRGKSRQTTVYSPLDLDDETLGLHRQMLEKRAEGNRRGTLTLLRKLADASGYPDSLVAYYRDA
ncbi:MAG: adenylate/guanylate cyclase domain-containing protein, partial [Candidatus Puniceispirillales bacterium]